MRDGVELEMEFFGSLGMVGGGFLRRMNFGGGDARLEDYAELNEILFKHFSENERKCNIQFFFFFYLSRTLRKLPYT